MADKRRYRSGMERIPGHVAAARLLNRCSGLHRAAWNALEIFDLTTAHEYLDDLAKAALNKPSEAEQVEAIEEVATLFALTAVMADRERRATDAESKTRVMKSKEKRSDG